MTEKEQTEVVETKPTTKSKAKEPKARTVKLSLDWKDYELSIDEKLPAEFLQTKLKEWQSYVPVGTYREIMRQIDEFDVPEFVEEKIMSWNNKYSVPQVVYKMYCEVKWYRYGRSKDPVILKGHWYSSISAGALLSDAIHGNMMTLEAKALRAALRYSYRIFEFPEIEIYDDWKTEGTIKEKKEAPKTEEEKATTQQVVDDIIKEDSDIESKIKARYSELMKELGAKVLTREEWPQKQEVLDIGTQLKNEFWEQYKKFIITMIMPDIDNAGWTLPSKK